MPTGVLECRGGRVFQRCRMEADPSGEPDRNTIISSSAGNVEANCQALRFMAS
jgi:hypothetical protein